MNYPSHLEYSICPHNTRYHLSTGCECEGCLIDSSERPALAEYGWRITEEMIWVKGNRRICDETGQHTLGGSR